MEKVKTASRMKSSAEKQQQKQWGATGSSAGGEIKTATDSLDESESAPGELLRMNVPTLNTLCF